MKKLEGKKIAILLEDGFEEIELTSPQQALEDAGAITEIISPKKDKVRAKQGDDWTGDYQVDKELSAANESDYDGLLLPGGVINPDKLRTNDSAIAFIQAFFHAKKPVAAICHGPQLLINAQVIKGKKVTSVLAIKEDLINAGAQWEDTEVVTDQGLVTSRTPDDLPAFNKKIIEEYAEGRHEHII